MKREIAFFLFFFEIAFFLLSVFHTEYGRHYSYIFVESWFMLGKMNHVNLFQILNEENYMSILKESLF